MLHYIYRVLTFGLVNNNIYMELLGHKSDTVSGSLFTIYTLQKMFVNIDL